MRPDRTPADLAGWLSYISGVHPRSIALGLERVRTVAERLSVVPPAPCNVVVAGTNGKGSTSVVAEALFRAQGARVGTALSPHLERFNERIRIDGADCDDAAICAAFAEVERARGDVLLTYFEFAMLATFVIFRRMRVDVAVLEVGLGGRLDAVNLVTGQVTVITSIGIDHVEYLGPDRENIGFEKAGILRPGVPLVYGEPSPPATVLARAAELGAPLLLAGVHFGAEVDLRGLRLTVTKRGEWQVFEALPLPRLAPDNVATAVQAVAALDHGADLDRSTLLRAFEIARLPGRFEHVSARGRRWVLDVAHNPHGATFLARQLLGEPCAGRTVAIAGFLKDKDAPRIVAALRDVVHDWTFVETQGERGSSGRDTFARVRAAAVLPGGEHVVARAASLDEALVEITARSSPDDRLVVLGSFDVVQRARSWLGAAA